LLQIQFERTGGFAGRRLTHSFSAESLPEEERSKLTQLIQEAHFFDLPPVMRGTGARADQFHYKISLKSDQGTHEIQLDEESMPEQLRPLVAYLQAAARKPPPV
jgi:hypothetical protein